MREAHQNFSSEGSCERKIWTTPKMMAISQSLPKELPFAMACIDCAAVIVYARAVITRLPCCTLQGEGQPGCGLVSFAQHAGCTRRPSPPLPPTAAHMPMVI